VRNLRQQQRPKKNTLIIGKKAVIEAMESGKQLERIYLQNNAGGETIEIIRNMAATKLVPVNKVPVEKLNGFNISNHEGCVAVISKIHYQDLQELISFVFEKGEIPLFIILDGITDIRNIGAIARTAYCCGSHGLIIPDKGIGALNEDAITTSAGALEQIAVCREVGLAKAVDTLVLNGIKVFASEMTAASRIDEINFSEPCGIIMGSEEKGVSPALLKVSNATFSIPMYGNFESLNVSVATGMVLYEAMRQRGFK
jgi:23S rRNA (guanosine2251-2'-O)-methyltransferase